MAFVDVNTGKKISLSKGYESRTIPYDEWRRQQEEKRVAGGTDSSGTASPRLGMTGADTSGEAWTRAVPSQTRVPAPKAGPADDIWARGSRYSGVGANPAAAPSRPASYQSGKDDYRDAWAQGLTGTERRERKEEVHRRLAELAGQAGQARVDLDTDTLNRVNDRMKTLRASIGEQTLGDRANDTLSGSVQSYSAGMVNAVGTVANAFNDPAYYRRQITALQKRLEAGGYSDGRRFVRDTEEGRQRIRDSIREMADKAWQLERPTSFVNRTYQLADRIQDDSAKSISSAKEGLGAAGQLSVDVGVAGTQMGMDALTAVLTGGSALIPMAVRSFGGGAQEARRSGADLDRQLLYGVGSAALSVETEKISNIAKPFQKMFGRGAAETIAGSLAKRFGENGAVQLMRRLSQTAAGRIALSAIGEGGEEVVEDVLQPFLKRATFDPNARFDAGEAGNDFLVGAILGGLGGVPEAVGRIGSGSARNRAETGAGADVRAQAGLVPRAETGVRAEAQPPEVMDAFLEGFLDGDTEPVRTRRGGGKGRHQGQTPVLPQGGTVTGLADSGGGRLALEGSGWLQGAGGLPGVPDQLYVAALQHGLAQPGTMRDSRAEVEVPALYWEFLQNLHGVQGAQPAVPLLPEWSGGGWEGLAEIEDAALVPMFPNTAEASLEGENQREFTEFQDILGDDAPKSLAEFLDLKYNRSEIFEFLERDRSMRSELISHPEMALPGVETATAPDAKFVGYVFNPENPRGWAKGKAFASRLGYSIENWKDLQREILRGAPRYTATFKYNNGYGDLYEQHMILYGLKGRPAHVIVGWILHPDGSVSMTTPYIKEMKQ